VVAAVLVVAAVVVGFWPKPPEPVYQGRKLSEWLGPNVRPNGETMHAVRSMGTNALSFLVEWLEWDRPSWECRIRRTRLGRMVWGSDDARLERMNYALMTFEALGTDAAPALPGLVRVMRGGRPGSAGAAAYAVGAIGEEGVAVTLDVLTNRQAYPRLELGAEAAMIRGPLRGGEVLVPPLMSYLLSNDPRMRGLGAMTLGRLGAEAPVVIPGLIRLLKDDDEDVRCRAIVALEHFGGHQAARALVPLLWDRNPRVRYEAGTGLIRIAPNMGGYQMTGEEQRWVVE
jgi:HEAT repeats